MCSLTLSCRNCGNRLPVSYVVRSRVSKECTKCKKIQPEDIAESVVYALSVPTHVQITELMIDATDPY